MSVPVHKFPKNERLCGKIRIQQLFEQGKTIKFYPLKIVYKVVEDEPNVSVKFLVSVPKRLIKKAVDRNTIKRRLREAYRLEKHQLIAFCQENNLQIDIAYLYLSNQMPTYKQLSEKVQLSVSTLLQTLSDSKIDL